MGASSRHADRPTTKGRGEPRPSPYFFGFCGGADVVIAPVFSTGFSFCWAFFGLPFVSFTVSFSGARIKRPRSSDAPLSLLPALSHAGRDLHRPVEVISELLSRL